MQRRCLKTFTSSPFGSSLDYLIVRSAVLALRAWYGGLVRAAFAILWYGAELQCRGWVAYIQIWRMRHRGMSDAQIEAAVFGQPAEVSEIRS